MKSEDESNKNSENNIEIAFKMGTHATVQREGEATSQVIQAYKGVRYDSRGSNLNHEGRSLKNIKEYKINENYVTQNIKQQAGFDAELIDEARRNKNNIRTGKKERVRTSDGIGQTNDMKYDHVILDSHGNVLDGSGSQMKFYGIELKKSKITYRVIDKIVTDKSWERYDTLIDIPAEQYEEAKKYAEREAATLRKQAEKLKKNNKIEAAELLEKKADSYEHAGKIIRKSTVRTDEAIKARINPELFVAKEVIKDINHAGIEVAKETMLASSVISIAQNIYFLASDDKSIGEATTDVAINVAKTGVVGYGMGVAETSIKSIMHSSNQEFVRRCGNSSLPTAIVTGTLEIGKSMKRYASGEISEEELFMELGEKGVGVMASGYGAAVGTFAGGIVGTMVPGIGNVIGATVGSFVGSILGYTVSSALYNGAFQSLKIANMSEKRRIKIEEIVREAIQINNNYIDELNLYLVNSKAIFREKIWTEVLNMKSCISTGDKEKYVEIIESLGKILNLNLQYKTFNEFDQAMNDVDNITL